MGVTTRHAVAENDLHRVVALLNLFPHGKRSLSLQKMMWILLRRKPGRSVVSES